MTDEDFEKLKELLDEELNYDPTSYRNMQEKNSKIPNLLQFYLGLYIEQKEELNNLQSRLKQLYASLYHKYKYPSKGDGIEFQYALDNKTEIAIYIDGNDLYIKNSLKVEKQKLQVEFLEKTIQNIKDMSWSIKTSLEQRKFFEGAS